MKIDSEALNNWQEILNNFGPRLTGTANHQKYILFLKNEILKMGFNISDYPFAIDKYEETTSSLTDNRDNSVIPNLGPIPYSGITNDDKIIGQLRWYDDEHDTNVSGKIALIEITNFPNPSSSTLKEIASYPKNAKMPSSFSNPLLPATLAIKKIENAKSDGAIGVILMWDKISEDLAKNEILPFTNSYLNIPAVSVHSNIKDKLQNIIDENSSVSMTINGSYENNTPTSSFTVTIEGDNPDNYVIINTHTDGPNSIEENGPVALLTMLKTIKENKIHFKNTLIFCFVSGHFQIQQAGIDGKQATSRLLKQIDREYNIENSSQKILGLTVEHLGGKNYKDDYKANKFEKIADSEPMYIYVSPESNKQITEASLEDVQPVGDYFLVKPNEKVYFGEGQPLYQDNWPVISFIAMPVALCQLPSEKTEPNMKVMYDQIKLIMNILINSQK